MNKRRKKKTNALFLVIFSILIICTILFFWHKRAISPNTTAKSENTKTESLASPNTDNSNAEVNNDSAATETVKENNLKNLSMPILMYHHIRDFNDPTDAIGTNLSVPPKKFADQLDLLKSKGYTTITLRDLDKKSIPAKPIILTFDDGYDNFYLNAYPELKKRGMTATIFIITGDIGKSEYMNESEIKELNSNGIEVGSHTISHPDLRTLSTAKAQNEIANSKETLEKLLGNKVISFCYPSGKFTEETVSILKNSGYEFAVTTNSKLTTFENLLELNRYRVNNDTSISAFLK
jgi:peptidoglycan/xylan/chitin deacetylase (PgdA/CDA1 family)